MFKLTLLISLTLCAVVSSSVSSLLPQLDGRIVGGEKASIGEFPYQLSLMNGNSHSCGASLLSPQIAVTAAHCVIGSTASSFKIRAGSISRTSGGQLVAVSKLIYHPQYSSRTLQNDVAVLKLASPLTLGPNVSTIELVKEAPAEGTRAVISGWGTTSSGAFTIPTELRFVTVKIVSREVCASKAYAYGNDIKPTMICATATGKDACQGDSGGPLAANGQLAGIVSWGYGCAAKNYPGVYADVAALRPWILENALKL